MPAIKICWIIMAILFFTGCERIADFTDGIARYKIFEIGATEYELEMSRKDISSLEKSLAINIYPMDTQLTELLRDLSVRDSFPPLNWKEKILAEFYWLNEIALIDKEQNILSRYPETGIKKLTYEPVFPDVLSLQQGRVMLAVEHSPLGSEVLVATGVYKEFELTGIIAVGFDPRTFIAQSKSPQEIILISDEEVVWTGRFDHLRSHMEDINWDDLVSKRVRGKIKMDQDDFFWFARAVGENWLIYLIKDN